MEIDLSKGIDDMPLGFGKYAKLTPRQVLARDPGYILWMSSTFTDERCSTDLVDEAREAMEPEDKPYTNHEQRRTWQQDEPDEDVVTRIERNNSRR